MNLVLDSSVVAKLFIDEKNSDKAAELFEKSSTKSVGLVASELILYEVGNVIWKHLRKKDMDGSEYVEQLFSLNIESSSLDQGLAYEAMRIAKTHDITYYDAVHIALSQRHMSVLVTEDKELLERFENAVSIEVATERLEKELGEVLWDEQ